MTYLPSSPFRYPLFVSQTLIPSPQRQVFRIWLNDVPHGLPLHVSTSFPYATCTGIPFPRLFSGNGWFGRMSASRGISR